MTITNKEDMPKSRSNCDELDDLLNEILCDQAFQSEYSRLCIRDEQLNRTTENKVKFEHRLLGSTGPGEIQTSMEQSRGLIPKSPGSQSENSNGSKGTYFIISLKVLDGLPAN